MANSAALNISGRKIADLPTAVARVGFNIVRSAALSFAMAQLRKSGEFRHLEPQLDAFWKSSVQIAAMCHVIARRFSSLNGDTALLAGLMHNVGRIYILTRASKYPTLIADPQCRTSAAGKNFAIATVRTPTEDGAILVSLIGFGDMAESPLSHRQGSTIAVSGRAKLTEWVGRDGKQNHGLEQIASASAARRADADRRRGARDAA